MTSKAIFIFVFSCFFAALIQAQKTSDTLIIGFNLSWQNQPLALNKTYYSKTDSLTITTVKFYVSGIELLFNDNSTFIEKDNYHLVDIENDSTLYILINKKTDKVISKITFNIGVDSLASVSGALSGDLDPTKGMYWAWQSGFINMKIEGKSANCKTRKNIFQFHIGGYLKPNYVMRKIEIPIIKSLIPVNNISINFDLAKLFNDIDLSKINTIVVPGEEAMRIADVSTKLFTIK